MKKKRGEEKEEEKEEEAGEELRSIRVSTEETT